MKVIIIGGVAAGTKTAAKLKREGMSLAQKMDTLRTLKLLFTQNPPIFLMQAAGFRIILAALLNREKSL